MTRPPTRVLHLITELNRGGAERVLVDLAIHTDRQRFDVAVATLNPDGALAPELRANNIPLLSATSLKGGFLAAIRSVRDVIASFRPDVLHLHLPEAGVVGRLAVRNRPDVAAIYTEQSIRGPYRAGGLILNCATLRLQKVFVAVSEEVRRSWAPCLWASRTETRVVRSGIPLPALHGAAEKREARRRIGLPEDAFVVGTVGNLFPVKGQRFLLDAFQRLEQPGGRLVIVGGGPLDSALKHEAARLGIAARTTFTGSRADAAELTSAFDVFVLSSLAEGMPIALLEAMGRGVAAVATAVGGAPEVVSDRDTGMLVPAGDPRALSSAIALLRGDATLREELAIRGRARVVKDFSVEAMVAGYQEIYERVAPSPR